MGHGQNVLIIQFLKWQKNTGEYLYQRKEPLLEVIQFGREGWKGLKNITKEDRHNSLRGLTFALDTVKKGKLGLLILDEINLAVHLNLLSLEEVKNLLSLCRITNTNVIMTGRHASKDLIEMSDIANEIKCIKSPKNGFICEEGIQW